jgi:predicted AlkP superfamily phosphohydrolase/phosphomutase
MAGKRVLAGDGAVRQLVIGVDAMDWDLVRGWVSAGKLPVLARVIREGLCAELSTTAAQFPDTVWNSISTGANPAKYEKYFYVQYDAASMGLRHLTDDDVHTIPVWNVLSEAGRRVGVVDFPQSSRTEPLNGFHVARWGTHPDGGRATSYPAGLMEEIRARFGSHPVRNCDAAGDHPASLGDLRNRILDGVRAHGELFRWLMRKEPWDVFFAGFSASHCAGHHFWRTSEKLSSTIEEVYGAIDHEIGQMMEQAGPDVRCLIVSGHGMGPLCHASWNLGEILELLGYGNRPARGVPLAAKREGRVNPWRLLKMMVPGRVQYAIRAALPKWMQDRLLFRWYAGGQDWRGCPAFAVPNNDSVGAIRISVAGRDQDGLVEPGAEYDEVCRDLSAAFRELTDPETGRKLVLRVTLTHEEFRGPFLDRLPDITVLWDQSFSWDAVHSPRFGTLRVRRQDARSGSHTPHGFALMRGPGVAAGLVLEGHSIYDIAATILDWAGVEIPAHFDGRPLRVAEKLFSDAER